MLPWTCWKSASIKWANRPSLAQHRVDRTRLAASPLCWRRPTLSPTHVTLNDILALDYYWLALTVAGEQPSIIHYKHLTIS